jgi:glutamate formiminotransferase / formiminotetrahydrofolate cyclodeaminase
MHGAGSAQQILDGGDELLSVKGLGDVFIASGFEAIYAITVECVRRDRDNGNVGMPFARSDTSCNIQSVFSSRQGDVHEDEVHLLLHEQCPGVVGPGSNMYCIGLAEQRFNEACALLVVFNEQNAFFLFESLVRHSQTSPAVFEYYRRIAVVVVQNTCCRSHVQIRQVSYPMQKYYVEMTGMAPACCCFITYMDLMNKIVECVPNFSEGRDQRIIDAIADAIRSTDGCTLLDVDPGKSTNRTVYTFVGSPDAVVEGALNAARVAKNSIDMSKHSGEHPRMGAMDVCPFVPVANITMEECVECAKAFGARAGEELGIPVYLYEEAQPLEYRKSLKQIRAGEYEAVADKIVQPEWKPDFGPAEFIPSWGATATGARSFLIAYNVNILGTKEQAHRIALNIREQGRGEDEPGRLKAVKGIGWYVDEYDMAQVSMNLDNFNITPPHIAFEECARDARELNLATAGSEIVGLIPLQAVMMAAEYYIQKENLFIIDEQQKIRLVIERLGLNSVSRFDPGKRIIEYMIEQESAEALASMTVRAFIELTGARTSAPGGGSASALIAATGAALGAMVGWMTYGKRKFEDKDAIMRRLIPTLHHAMKDLIPMIDADTNAFNDYMEALSLPKGSDEERDRRQHAMQEGLKKAVNVPLETMRIADRCWEAMEEMATHGNFSSRSDLEVGAKALETGIWGAYKNVLINLESIKDNDFILRVRGEAEGILASAKERCISVLGTLEQRGEQ